MLSFIQAVKFILTDFHSIGFNLPRVLLNSIGTNLQLLVHSKSQVLDKRLR